MLITGTKSDGCRFEQKLTKRTTKVHIDQRDLVELDLSALAELPALRNFYIRADRLEALSLAPLANAKLEKVSVIAELPALDLSPLATVALPELTISGGQAALDLSPLHPALTELMIFDGPLETIDLAPLARCTKLRLIWLRMLQLRELDLRPLASLPGFQAAVLDGSRLASVNLGTTGFRALTHLDLSKNPLEHATLDPLATSPRLKSLRVPRDFALPFERDEIVRV